MNTSIITSISFPASGLPGRNAECTRKPFLVRFLQKCKVAMMGLLLLASSHISFASFPDKVFAPYVDVMLYPTFSLMDCYNATGQKYFTLAFIIAGYDNTPMWGGSLAMSSEHMLDQINQLREVGGDVIVSFGGANGSPIESVITDVTSLVTAYSNVIDKYSLTWIDFDIEGWWVQDATTISLRNQAAKLLQDKYPDLRISYCLPVMPTGLTSDGSNVITKAIAAGVDIYSVNVMAMDYGSANSAMGTAAINAAENTYSQTGLNIGITPMIGQNDTQGEIFSLTNASEVLSFARSASYVNMLAMWSAGRDNGDCAGSTTASATCSGVTQNKFDFINIFKAFSGTTDDDGCTSTTIVPYISVDGGTLQNISSVTVTEGSGVTLSPEPTSGGSWTWSGPNSYSSTSREITISNIQTSQAGNYVATYTNTGGCTSTKTFTITVSSSDSDDSGDNSSCADLTAYPDGLGSYEGGDTVTNNGGIYVCKEWPYSGWANIGGPYEPGVGWAWEDAWTYVGTCTASAVSKSAVLVNSTLAVKNTSVSSSDGMEINVTISTSVFVKLVIRNLNGQIVETLASQNMETGSYTFTWNPQHVASGTYIVNLVAGTESKSIKIMLIK